MRTTLILFLSSVLLLPLIAQAQFGPIVPEVCRTCACGFGGVLAIIQNVVNFIIGLSIIVATIIMVWAGGLYILSATNPESRSTANKMLINAAVGLLIVLSAWLIVDFVMKTLYDNDSEFGPWNSILMSGSGDSCVVAKPTSPLFSGDLFVAPGQGTGASGGGSCTPLADSQLATFDPSATDGRTRRGTPDTVQRFMSMRAAAARDGITLKAGSAYRSPEEGEDLWRSHGCQVVNGRTVCSNGSEVAKPCSIGGGGSNHTKGTAIDIETNAAGTAWLRRNAAQYGFYNRIAAEPWHWSDSGY